MFVVHFSILVILWYTVQSRGGKLCLFAPYFAEHSKFLPKNPPKKHVHLDKAAESTLRFWLNTDSMTEISIALKPGLVLVGAIWTVFHMCLHSVPKKAEQLQQFPVLFNMACTLSKKKKSVILPKSLSSPMLLSLLLSHPLNLSEFQSVPGGPGFVSIQT